MIRGNIIKIYPITIPGGSDTYVQYNNNGIFDGIAGFTVNDATGVVTATGITVPGSAVLGLNSAVFQPTADSTTFFQILDAAGVVLYNLDSTETYITLRLSLIHI